MGKKNESLVKYDPILLQHFDAAELDKLSPADVQSLTDEYQKRTPDENLKGESFSLPMIRLCKGSRAYEFLNLPEEPSIPVVQGIIVDSVLWRCYWEPGKEGFPACRAVEDDDGKLVPDPSGQPYAPKCGHSFGGGEAKGDCPKNNPNHFRELRTSEGDEADKGCNLGRWVLIVVPTNINDPASLPPIVRLTAGSLTNWKRYMEGLAAMGVHRSQVITEFSASEKSKPGMKWTVAEFGRLKEKLTVQDVLAVRKIREKFKAPLRGVQMTWEDFANVSEENGDVPF